MLERIRNIRGRFGITQGPEHGYDGVIACDADHARDGDSEIGDGFCNIGFRGLQKMQDFGGKSGNHGGEDGSDGQHDDCTVYDGFLHLGILSGSEELGHHNTNSQAYAIAEAEGHEVQRTACTDGPQGIGTYEISYNDRIHHIVELVKDITHKHWGRKAKQKECDVSFRHISNFGHAKRISFFRRNGKMRGLSPNVWNCFPDKRIDF